MSFKFKLAPGLQAARSKMAVPCSPVSYNSINKILKSIQSLVETAPQKDCESILLSAHILLVEDNTVNQMVAVGILEKLGCTAEIAENGKVAVDRFIQGKFNLILMDYHMPVMDGLQATHIIRDHERQNRLESTPIVALTANVLKSELERYLNEGMNDYLSKPFTAEQLYDRLQKWICCNKDEQKEQAASQCRNPSFQDEEHTDEIEQHASLTRLQELESLLGNNYSYLINTFLTNSGKYLAELQEQCSRIRDVEEIARLAHNLKGTTGNIGAISMHKYAIQLEKLARENNLTVMPELLAEIENAFDAFRRVVQRKAS